MWLTYPNLSKFATILETNPAEIPPQHHTLHYSWIFANTLVVPEKFGMPGFCSLQQFLGLCFPVLPAPRTKKVSIALPKVFSLCRCWFAQRKNNSLFDAVRCYGVLTACTQRDKANYSRLRTSMLHEEVENREVLTRAGQHFIIENLVREGCLRLRFPT